MAKNNSEIRQRRRDHWRELLGRWKASGLSRAQFCRRRGISARKLGWWARRLGGEGVRADDLFVPVRVEMVRESAGALELALRGGRVLRFGAEVEPAKLAAIVAALEGLPC